MSHPGLVERLLSELATARVAIGASYQRLWSMGERTLRASTADEPKPPPLPGIDRPTDSEGSGGVGQRPGYRRDAAPTDDAAPPGTR